MATTADFRNGLCIVFKDDLYRIVQFQHVKPGDDGMQTLKISNPSAFWKQTKYLVVMINE